MKTPQEKYLTHYLKDFNLEAQDIKTSNLPKITQTVHERNDLIAELKNSEKEFRKKQVLEEIKELDEHIASLLKKVKDN